MLNIVTRTGHTSQFTRGGVLLMDKTMLVPVNVSRDGAAPIEESRPAGLGMIGLGSFGRFCLEAYLQVPEARVVAIADPDPTMLAAGSHLAPFAATYSDARLLLARPEVDVVHICTPPDQHLALVLAAILAGKHVICEKPLGISLREFDTAVAAATRHGVVLGINLVLRHDPLYQAVQALARSGVLGRPHRLAVENYADEAIVCGPEHWLWDPARSGGLALAADIHWLDLATRLLGPAQSIQTWQPTAQEGVVPRRLITTTHRSDAVASVYHAFDTRSDATGCIVLIALEEGEARVEGWIPRQLTIACPATVGTGGPLAATG
jgi:predicted dehydrogenase